MATEKDEQHWCRNNEKERKRNQAEHCELYSPTFKWFK